MRLLRTERKAADTLPSRPARAGPTARPLLQETPARLGSYSQRECGSHEHPLRVWTALPSLVQRDSSGRDTDDGGGFDTTWARAGRHKLLTNRYRRRCSTHITVLKAIPTERPRQALQSPNQLDQLPSAAAPAGGSVSASSSFTRDGRLAAACSSVASSSSARVRGTGRRSADDAIFAANEETAARGEGPRRCLSHGASKRGGRPAATHRGYGGRPPRPRRRRRRCRTRRRLTRKGPPSAASAVQGCLARPSPRGVPERCAAWTRAPDPPRRRAAAEAAAARAALRPRPC